MSRIRYLKPGFFSDEDLADCSHLARLLFAGLWTIADREGRLEDRPRRIRAEVLPYEDCDTDALLRELADHGPLILRYSAEGKHYICIPGWKNHQKPHYKEGPSVIPPHADSPPDDPTVPPITKEQRERIYQRDSYACVFCGSGERLTIDHITPRTAGGSGDDANLQTMCLSCNSSKGNRTSVQRRIEVGPKSVEPPVDEPGGNGEWVTGNGDSKGDGQDLELLSDSGESNDASPDDFDLFWTHYPRKESKQSARRSWKRVPKKDRTAAAAAAESMRDCVDRGWQEKTFCPHPSTFLNQRRWEDWADGPPPNYLPEQRKAGNLTDVLDAGGKAFGLIGETHGQLGTGEDADDGPEGTPAGGEDAWRRLPAGELAAGQ